MSEPTPPEPVRRRSVLGVSGWLLFVCLFLPTLRVCGDPMMPIQFPPDYAVYFGAIGVGIIGFATAHVTRRNWAVIILSLWLTTLLTILTLAFGAQSAPVGFVTGALSLWILIWSGRAMIRAKLGERSVAVSCLIHAVISIGWSALLALDKDGMWGATVSLGAASLMLFAAGGYWAWEQTAEHKRQTAPSPLPAARVIT
ncbi:hypothetical protein BH11MYX3_BH11MYX3_40610 [soil metagenome]